MNLIWLICKIVNRLKKLRYADNIGIWVEISTICVVEGEAQ